MPQTVYVLSNVAMPGLVKIGFTAKQSVETRISQLYTTGVPVPFKIEFALRVDDDIPLEKALHTAFAPNRINQRREFFKIDPEQAIAILRVFPGTDVTKQLEEEEAAAIDSESKAADENLRKRRPPFNFEQMGIPVGATLHFSSNEHIAEVVSGRKVRLNGEEMSLSAATDILSDTDYNAPAPLLWTFNGETIREIYNRTYESID